MSGQINVVATQGERRSKHPKSNRIEPEVPVAYARGISKVPASPPNWTASEPLADLACGFATASQEPPHLNPEHTPRLACIEQ